MGCRITDNPKRTDYDMRYVEVSPAGIERLEQRGLEVTSHDRAVAEADVWPVPSPSPMP